ncbi:MAG: hypothetical protein KDC38_10815, partial [Planctomycetes bacterium]|nr:hypothetical protein [Planctomycetota bacterium]
RRSLPPATLLLAWSASAVLASCAPLASRALRVHATAVAAGAAMAANEGASAAGSRRLDPPLLVDEQTGHEDLDGSHVDFTASGQLFPNARFSLERESERWDEAQRYEIGLAYHAARDLQVETVTGGYLYYERKRWEEGAAELNFESVGVGMEAGAYLYPLTREPGSPIDLAIYPYIRYGIGTAGGHFRNIPIDTSSGSGTSSGDPGDFRVEGGLGADLRLAFGRAVRVGAGIGVLWWDTLETAVISVRNGSGTVIVEDDHASLRGRDTFVRLSLEISF